MTEEGLLGKHKHVLNLMNNAGVNAWEGWFPLIDRVLGIIDRYNKHKKTNVKVLQIKEKFGMLRIYTDNPRYEYIEGMLDGIETISSTICERCGSPGERRTDIGWHKTLCLDHYSARKLELAVEKENETL